MSRGNGKLSPAAMMVREFHRVSGHSPGHGLTREGLRVLRSKLILEECGEAADAIMGRKVMGPLTDDIDPSLVGPWNRPAIAKELADILIVTYGAADVFSIPLDDVLIAVHASNMTKDFSAPKRADGKIMKGATYQPPNLGWV